MGQFLLATDNFEKLKSAADYREFLRDYLALKGLTLSKFARLTGHARGYPSDVIGGRRRLTLQSFRSFEKALKLPPSGKKFFRCLVAAEESDIFPSSSLIALSKSLVELRLASWQPAFREVSEILGAEDLLKKPSTLMVLASLGTPESGAHLDEISVRSGFPKEVLIKILKGLIEVRMVTTLEDKYYGTDFHLFLSAQHQRESFKSLFQTVCSSAGTRATNHLESKEEMFLSSFLCIKSERLPEFKIELKQLLLRFVDDCVSPDGDQTVSLVAALFKGS